MKLTHDTHWFRSSDGKHLLAGSPLTSFTVSESGARILDAIENSSDLPSGHGPLTTRLLATGAVHPVVTTGVPVTDITVVIPAFVGTEATLDRLTALVQSLNEFKVIVVDDASPIAVEIPQAQVIHHDSNTGPAGARNTGLQEVHTTYVAFVDTDAQATSHDLQELASVLIDSSVVLAAPRIITHNKETGIDEYESHCSSLDLGDEPAVVRPLSRVSYVPATVLVAHTERLRERAGFDSSLRLGEDVDLVWRIVESGQVVRYVPSVTCKHFARTSWRQFVQQRFAYGSSAAALDKRHPYAASPLRAHALLLILAISVLSAYLYLTVILALPVVAYFVWTLRSTKVPVPTRIDLAWTGFTSTLRLLALAVRRAWWPIFILCSFFSVRITAMYTFALFTPLMFGILRHKPRAIGSYIGLRFLDDISYGAGVWFGAIRHRSLRCLLPVITLRRTSRTK